LCDNIPTQQENKEHKKPAISISKGLIPVSSVRGATFFRTQSPKLSRLNSVVRIYELEVNKDQSYNVKDWEWK